MTTTTFERLHDQDGSPSFGQFVVYKLGKMLDRKAFTRSRVHARMQSIVKLVLHLAGFACLTIAGFQVSTVAGFVVAGLSAFALSWLIAGQPEPAMADGSTRR
jgi:hypothetical protein